MFLCLTDCPPEYNLGPEIFGNLAHTTLRKHQTLVSHSLELSSHPSSHPRLEPELSDHKVCVTGELPVVVQDNQSYRVKFVQMSLSLPAIRAQQLRKDTVHVLLTPVKCLLPNRELLTPIKNYH